jgi:hypothetical protein
MRRIARHLFTIVAALSLVLCAAVCMAWVRSHRLSDYFGWCNAGGWREFYSAEGHLVIHVMSGDYSTSTQQFQPPAYRSEPLRYVQRNWLLKVELGENDDTLTSWERGGFAWHERRNARLGARYVTAVAPMWSVAALTAVAPLAWTIARLRGYVRARRRSRRGLCVACGYDLRASAQRCPECGTESLTAT